MTIKLDHIYAQNSVLLDLAHKKVSIERAEALFINAIHSSAQQLELQHLNLSVENINFGGLLSKKSQVLFVEAKKNKIKRHKAYFLISHNGFALMPRCYKLMLPSYFEPFKEKPAAQRIDFIQSHLKTLEEQQEFSFFNALMDKLFETGVEKLQSYSKL